MFFYEVQNEIQSLMVKRCAALGLSRSPGGPFLSAQSFHVFWAGLAFSSQKIPLFCHPIASGTSREGLGLAFPLF